MAFFTKEMRSYFGASVGAFSEVTHREATGDRSVTLDTDEKNVIYSVYSPTSFARRGGVTTSANPTHKEFIIHDESGRTSRKKLSVVFPKQKGEELRLYFSKRAGFEADEGDIWYIFAKDGESIPNIGSMKASNWKRLLTSLNEMEIVFKSQQNLDDEDEVYQKEIGAAAVKIPTTTSTLKYPRSASVALKALQAAHYLCEGNSKHLTFKSVNGKPYLECHHLIPISLQARFTAGLDVEENLVALCPTCHRLVHYGVGEEKRELLDKLWESKKQYLADRGIKIRYEDLLAIYMV